MRAMLSAAAWGLLGLVCAYAAVLAALWWGQERLLFQPQRLAGNHRFGFPADVHETWVDVPGARLNALHLKLPTPRGLVFYLHGNAGSLHGWFANADWYRRMNFDLFMIDYRGYGKSSGRIVSQPELEADVRAAWDAVAPQYVGKPRVVFGRSLGSALAAGLAAEVQPELTVLVSPYSSMAALAREHYPWVPQRLLRYPLPTEAALARVRGDVLLLHGGRDALIPPVHSQRLQAAAPHATLVHVDSAGHNDIQEFRDYLDAFAAALARL